MVTSIAPAAGPLAGNTNVSITGVAFVSGATMTIGGLAPTNITFVGTTSITATTPAHAAGAADVVVTTPGGNGTLSGGFIYLAMPTVTTANPASGPTAGGTTVMLTGTAFVGGATVTFGGVAATSITVVNGTTINATTPANVAGAGDIVVTMPGGAGALTSSFTFVAPPDAISVNPTSGTTNGGTSIVISGTGFVNGATVTIDGLALLNVIVASSTSITGTTPVDDSNLADISVTNPDSQSDTLAAAYNYVLPPTATGISPTSGTVDGGTNVTVTGTDFQTGATFTVGGVAATSVTVVDSGTITARTVARAAAVVDVVVANPDAQTSTLAGAYTYLGSLTITAAPANLTYSGSGAGWNLQATVGTLTSGPNTIPPANQTIRSVSVSGVTGTAPTNAVVYPMAVPTAAAEIFNAALNTGTGQTTMTFSTQIAVPADAYAGTYSAVLTVTFAAGP